MSLSLVSSWPRCGGLAAALLGAFMLCPVRSAAQTWNWTTEQIDTAGTDSSIAIDHDGNLHVSYHYPAGGRLKYAFRSAGDLQWYKMVLDEGLGDFSTRITVDASGRPNICYTPRILKFAQLNGHKWHIQEISPGSGLISYTCSVSVAKDGNPQLSWFVETGTYLRYAALNDGIWEARILDLGGLPGKWNTLVLDGKGYPRVSYNHFPEGSLKYTYFDGKSWINSVIDSMEMNPAGGERGMGNSIVLDDLGNPLISYYTVDSLKMARFAGGKWMIETVEQLPNFGHWSWKNFQSTILLDSKRNPHITFESLSGLEHAWWDGAKWHAQLIVAASGVSFFDNAMAMDPNDVMYVSYTDPVDQSLKLVTGKQVQAVQTAKTGKQDHNEKQSKP
jgi:hypothetical protein